MNDGLLNAFLLDGQGGGTPLDWAGVRNWAPDQGALWVHLDFTKEGTHQWLQQESGLDSLVEEALTADETRPRCEAIDDGLLLSLRGVNTNPGSEPEDMVSIRLFCTGERVISTRRRQLLSIADLIQSLERGNGPRTTGELTAMLAERLIERMVRVINDLEEHIDEMEENVILEAGQESRGNILDLRREIILLRRYIAPQRDAMNQLSAADAAWLSKKNRLRLRASSDTITRHVEDLDSAKDRASVAYEELSSRLSEQMNSRMYVLSLVAGLFLPLGFLTGLLGINVGGIPLAEDPRGFIEVVVFMVLLIVVQVIVFRRKKWF